ncbi:hypothetical protein V1519DRAFT_447561 [Lipomyces tetrasporus]
MKYDCGPKKPCVCYFGEYEGCTECPKCGGRRFIQGSKKPDKPLTYIPLERRIRAIFSQLHLSKMVQEYSAEVMLKYVNVTLADFGMSTL